MRALLSTLLLALLVTAVTPSAADAAAPTPRPLITLAADVAPGPAGSRPTDLVPVGDVVYFLADSADTGQRHLWSWDARTGVTEQLTPARSVPGACCMSELTRLEGALYFADERDDSGVELWRYVIATGVIERAADVEPGPTGSEPTLLTVAGGKLYFVTGVSLREFDPVAADPVARPIAFVSTSSMSAEDILGTADTLYLNITVLEPVLPRGVVALDTRTGTFSVLPVVGALRILGEVDGSIYFVVDDKGEIGAEPWRYDPATGEAGLLADLGTVFGGSSPTEVVGLGGLLYLDAIGTGDRRELWRVDPRTGRAAQAADIAPGPSVGSEPRGLTVLNDKLYFQAHATAPLPGRRADFELWVFDPQARGGTGAASMVEELRTAPAEREGSAPSELTPIRGGLVFSATDDTLGPELYQYRPRPRELAAVLYGGEQVPAPTAVEVTTYLRNDTGTALSGRLRLDLVGPDGTQQRRTVRTDQRVPAHDTVVVTVQIPLAADAVAGRYTGVLALVGADRVTAAAGGFRFDVTR